MAAPTHLLVANPAAQSGRNAARIDRALRLLDAAGLRARLLPTLPEGRTVGAVREAVERDGYVCVIAMGGDGTFREVGHGVLESSRREEVAAAMLPTGTANNFGRSFGLTASDGSLEQNVRVIAARQETRLDAGRLHCMTGTGETLLRAMFFDSVGWGIGARVIAQRNLDRSRVERLGPLKHLYRDRLVYAGALARMLVATSSGKGNFGASMIADGEAHELGELAELLVKGTRIYAGEWVIDRTSRHDDGMFEVAAFKSGRVWMTKGTVNVYGNAAVEDMLRFVGVSLPQPFRASRLAVRFRAPEGSAPPPVQVDGEEFPASERAEIEVVPRALRLIVPHAAVSPR